MTSQLIRLSTNFMTLIPSLPFTDYEWFPWSICNGCGMPAGNAYPSGHLVASPIVGLACAPIVETRFLELAMSLLDLSPRIPLGTFSILLDMWAAQTDNYIMKNSCTHWNSNTRPSAYEYSFSVVLIVKISIEYLNIDNILHECVIKLFLCRVARGRCRKYFVVYYI